MKNNTTYLNNPAGNARLYFSYRQLRSSGLNSASPLRKSSVALPSYNVAARRLGDRCSTPQRRKAKECLLKFTNSNVSHIRLYVYHFIC